MEVIYIRHPKLQSITAEMESCVLALGFFDGVHIGHQGILEKAKQIAKQKQCTFGVMTFYPHPKEVLFPDSEPMTYLTPLPVKEERFAEQGVEKRFIVEFTPDFARLSPEDFVKQYIMGLRCVHVVAGFDYYYGYKGLGDMETLSKYRPEHFEVTTVHKIEHECEKISSTAIRQLLADGRIKDVPKYLGDYYEVQGIVKQNTLFYKNNQFLKVLVEEAYRVPKLGVYRIQVELDGKTYEGICHQMSMSGHQSSLLIQLRNCFVDTYRKRMKVKWIDYMYGKQNESYGINEYMHKDGLVI